MSKSKIQSAYDQGYAGGLDAAAGVFEDVCTIDMAITDLEPRARLMPEPFVFSRDMADKVAEAKAAILRLRARFAPLPHAPEPEPVPENERPMDDDELQVLRERLRARRDEAEANLVLGTLGPLVVERLLVTVAKAKEDLADAVASCEEAWRSR